MTSRSRFYVDTPRDPSQRHSMFVTHSELVQRQDLSSNSSSATLPSAAGSVDRLTGLEEKKSSRFFTLKPKTSFSLRPFFRSTSSLVSQSPGKRRKALLERRDSYVQTEETRPEFGDVGVQTLNASTVDVPVQTCLEAWEEGNSYGQRRLAYATPRTSPFWSQPSVNTSALSNSLLPKNTAKDPLASPKLIKYAAPNTSEKTPLHHQSAVSPPDVNSCQPVSPSLNVTSSSLCAPVKDISAKESPGNVSFSPQNQSVNKPQNVSVTESQCTNIVPLNLNRNLKEGEISFSESETSPHEGYTKLDNQSPEVSNDLKTSHNIEYPLSALKSERTDSPSRRLKTVHFHISESVQPQNLNDDPSKPRNIDKDFEALLKDLNILTDDENDSSVPLNCVSREKDALPNLPSNIPIIPSSLKSALDALREDFLAPIPENLNEYTENELSSESKLVNSGVVTKDTTLDIKSDSLSLNSNPVAVKKSPVNSISEHENQNSEENKNDPLTPTSLPIFISANSSANPETDSLEGNVYDNVTKEENSVKAIPLPTLPSFFETPSQPQTAEITEFVDYVKPNNTDNLVDKETESAMPLETEFDRGRLSRSSSRSSIKSNSKLRIDSCRETMSRFDSCENLDQLEEEIIRSLYSPDEEKIEDTILKNIELPPSESFQNSGTTATHMRRVILDQLLSGKSVQDIVPNYPVYQRTHSVPETESKFKSSVKYTAVLTKMNLEDNEKNSPENSLDSSNISSILPVTNSVIQKVNDDFSPMKHTNVSKIDSPKKTSIFIFPEDSVPNGDSKKPVLEISSVGNQNKSSLLEVRRSSWTPQTAVESPSDSEKLKKISSSNENTSDDKSGQCDFTNCLRPSKLQNSSFLAKINTRSMSPCNFSPLPHQSPSPAFNTTTVKKNISPKPPNNGEANGECDFGSCLKPSQVHNSLFTAELSEITANKSTNSLRVGSPLCVRTHSPLPLRSSSLDIPCVTPTLVEEENVSTEPIKHKSELSITLQTASNHSNNSDSKSETPLSSENSTSTEKTVSETLESDQNASKTCEPDQEPTRDSVIPPPPPPPPPSDLSKCVTYAKEPASCSMDIMLQDQKTNLTSVETSVNSGSVSPKTPVMIELEQRLQDKNDPSARNTNDQSYISTAEVHESTNAGIPEAKLNGSSNHVSNGSQNGNIGFHSEQKEYGSPTPNGKHDSHLLGNPKLTFSPKTVVTDESPPPGAILLDKKVTVDGDKVHTDKFFAIPMKEVLKEKTSTTKFIPAPPKYEGIGPTEDGIPIGLRNSVKKENMHNWYKTMFKSLHKADSSNDSQEYIIGYTSEPETSRKDMMLRKKSSTLDSRKKHDVNSNLNKQNYPPSVKSSIEVYNVRPRLIEDYEPGYSSVTDDNVTTSRRFLPSKNTVKPSYEFKNGYESDSNITKKRDQPEGLNSEQQKMWYREIQKGADIPQFGLGKQVPEKPKDPCIGPLPPPPLNYTTQPSYQQAVRPLTLPVDYSNQNGNGYCQQVNGAYEMQIRHAIHSEMQQRMSPSTNQLSPPNRTMMKSPSKSPDIKLPAQALFDFKSESSKEISLKKGDTVLILRQLDKNWYEGEHNGVIGIFPISYVEIIPPEHVATPVKVRAEGMGKALYDFVAQTSIELTVRKGDTVTLLRRVDSNWFEGIFNSKKGIVPISYIQVLQEPADRNIVSPSQKSYTTSLSNLENTEKLSKPSSLSPSAYSSSSASPLPVNPERRKLSNKKGSNLIEPIMYRALYSYSPQNSDELELQEGDNVYVVEMCDDGWYVGTSVRNGVFGIFPGNYVEKA